MPRKLILGIGLFDAPCGSVAWSVEVLLELLEIASYVNREWLACTRSARLADLVALKKIAWKADPADAQLVLAIPGILARGGSASPGLAAWLHAELRLRGEAAEFVIEPGPAQTGALVYRVRVRRASGAVVDPAQIAGWTPDKDPPVRARKTLRLELGLFEARCGSVTWSENVVRRLLEVSSRANREVLACAGVPSIHAMIASGRVRYTMDPRDMQLFLAIPEIIARKGAACASLAPWLHAELRAAGEPADFVITRHEIRGAYLYHARVQRKIRTASGAWVDGPVEDPSLEAGMRGAA